MSELNKIQTALDYVTKLGIDFISQYEHYLLVYATRLLKDVPGLRLVGTAHGKASVLSFTLQGYTNDEVSKALNQEGIARRTGHQVTTAHSPFYDGLARKAQSGLPRPFTIRVRMSICGYQSYTVCRVIVRKSNP